MSTNYTEHFQLPQWEADDPILRADFNAAMEKLDALYVTGSYIGNGKTAAEGGQTFDLGFRPRCLLVTRGWAHSTTSGSVLHYILLPGMTCAVLALTDTGFSVSYVETGSLMLNTADKEYYYIAFR